MRSPPLVDARRSRLAASDFDRRRLGLERDRRLGGRAAVGSERDAIHASDAASDANGWTSSRVDLERALTIEDLWGTGSDDVWGVGWGTIVHWDGASWAWRGLDSWPTPPYSSSAFPDLTTVWGSCSGGVWATSTGSHYIGDLARDTGVFFFHTEGETLTHTTALQAIAGLGAWYVWGQSWGSAATDLYVAGYLQAQRAGTSPDGFSPVLLHFDGEAWQSIDFTAGEPETRALAVWGASASDVWVGGQSGLYWFDGVTWTAVLAPGSDPITRLWGTATDDVWCARGVLHWDGLAWSSVDTGPSADMIRSGCAADACHVWLIGGDRVAPLLLEGAPS